MKSILKIEKSKILNIKFKKFKNLKKNHTINKIKLSNFIMSEFYDTDFICKRIMLLEALVGETFKINKFKFYLNNKKHSYLGALIFLKIDIFKKKVFSCLSYFYIYQLFLYFEFFLKVKNFNSTEFDNYFRFKPILDKNSISNSFYFFTCWGDLNNSFLYPSFKQTLEIFDNDERESLKYVEHIKLGFILFYKFNKIFLKTLQIIKKNTLKLLIFFFKKFFFKKLQKIRKIKKVKLFFLKKYLLLKKNVKT